MECADIQNVGDMIKALKKYPKDMPVVLYKEDGSLDYVVFAYEGEDCEHCEPCTSDFETCKKPKTKVFIISGN